MRPAHVDRHNVASICLAEIGATLRSSYDHNVAGIGARGLRATLCRGRAAAGGSCTAPDRTAAENAAGDA